MPSHRRFTGTKFQPPRSSHRCSRNSPTSSASPTSASAFSSRLAMLAVYRLGSHIPTPGINADMLAQFFNPNSGSALGLVDLFSGGNLRKLTVFALGIMPYITASIIFQLLTVIYEPLAKLQKEGELGRRKITQWTRYVTVLLGIVQSFAIALSLTGTQTGSAMVTIPRASSSFRSASLRSPPAPPSSCGWVSRSPSAASATACRCSSSPASSSACLAASRSSTTRPRPAPGEPSLPSSCSSSSSA